MNMKLTIRPTTAADLAAVDALLARAYPKLLKNDYPPSILVTALPLISRARPELLQSGTYFVAVDDTRRVLGAGGWTRDRRDRARAHVRHVVTDDRVLRRGVGRALIDHVLDTAGEAGIRHMECWATYTAVPFYEAMGFRQLGSIEVPLAPGIAFPSVRMQRRL